MDINSIDMDNIPIDLEGDNDNINNLPVHIPPSTSYKVVQLATMSMPYSIVLAMNTDYDVDAVPSLVSPFQYSLSLS